MSDMSNNLINLGWGVLCQHLETFRICLLADMSQFERFSGYLICQGFEMTHVG